MEMHEVFYIDHLYSISCIERLITGDVIPFGNLLGNAIIDKALSVLSIHLSNMYYSLTVFLSGSRRIVLTNRSFVQYNYENMLNIRELNINRFTRSSALCYYRKIASG